MGIRTGLMPRRVAGGRTAAPMRITGGMARGIPLLLPRAAAVRPATDALRQAVFSSLAALVPGTQFLDLFAGSGAYGLEAFSRGAAGGIFVEQDARTAGFIRSNMAAVGKSLGRDTGQLRVITADATSVALTVVPDLVFIDPPYEAAQEVAPKLFDRLAGLLKDRPSALIVFEMPGKMELSPPGWKCLKRLGKGGRQPTACIFKASSGGL